MNLFSPVKVTCVLFSSECVLKNASFKNRYSQINSALWYCVLIKLKLIKLNQMKHLKLIKLKMIVFPLQPHWRAVRSTVRCGYRQHVRHTHVPGQLLALDGPGGVRPRGGGVILRGRIATHHVSHRHHGESRVDHVTSRKIQIHVKVAPSTQTSSPSCNWLISPQSNMPSSHLFRTHSTQNYT